MEMYGITKEEAYHIFRTGGELWASSVGSDKRLPFALQTDTKKAPINWVTEHTRLQSEGLIAPAQYWTV